MILYLSRLLSTIFLGKFWHDKFQSAFSISHAQIEGFRMDRTRMICKVSLNTDTNLKPAEIRGHVGIFANG